MSENLSYTTATRASMDTATLRALKDLSILVIEDDVIALSAIEQGIRPFVRHFYAATDGAQGIEIFSKNKIDIVITDLHLPNLNGFEVISRIQNSNPAQPFIVITSYDSDENTMKSIQRGAFGYMRKPIRIIDLQTQLLRFAHSMRTEDLGESLGALRVDPLKQLLYKNGRELRLSKRLGKIFWVLYFNKNSVVSYEAITNYAYGRPVSIDALRMAILRLKKQLGDAELIQNISGSGYMLSV